MQRIVTKSIAEFPYLQWSRSSNLSSMDGEVNVANSVVGNAFLLLIYNA